MSQNEVLSIVETLPLFSNSSKEFLKMFSGIALAKNAKKGDVILTQGKVNGRFLVLVSGTVEVLVKGESVATLNAPGDLMGEMSALIGRIVTASLQALTDVKYLEISGADLNDNIAKSKDVFGYELYCLLAQVLSDKMIRTNEKARQFEVANRSLSATMDLLQETQRTMDRRIREKLIGTSLQGSRILLIESDKKQQSIAKLSLGGLGSEIDFAANQDEAVALLDGAKKYDLVFLNLAQADMLSTLKQKVHEKKIVVIASHDRNQEIEKVATFTTGISNLISKNEQDRNITVRNMTLAATKLLGNDLFGLEKYLIWGVEVQSHNVSNSDQRAGLIEEMQSHFKTLGLRSTLSERASSVAEEILMNAIYDAPVDEKGAPAYNHISRTQKIELKKNQEAEFRFACDGMFAGISVSDQSGTLSLQILTDYLQRDHSADNVNAKAVGKGGAGRGLHMIVESSDLVIFNVQPGRRTEVIALFNLDPRAKDEEAAPLFHYFVS